MVSPPAVRSRLAAGSFLRLVRYASVSAVATVVGLGTLATLVGVGHWPAGWANVVATAVGTVPSFELNRRWVWGRGDGRSLRRQVVPFVLLCGVELLCSTAAVHAASTWAAGSGLGHVARTAVDLVANVATYGALWVLQYVVCDRLLFRSPLSGPSPHRFTSPSGTHASMPSMSCVTSPPTSGAPRP